MRLMTIVLCGVFLASACGEKREAASPPARSVTGRRMAVRPVTPHIAGIVEVESPAVDEAAEPFLSSAGPVVAMTWVERAGKKVRLRFSRLENDNWSDPSTVAEGDLIDNFADFPSLLALSVDRFAVAWPEKSAGADFAQTVRTAVSNDGGRSWVATGVPYSDTSAVARGFTSLVAAGDAARVVWADGRAMPQGEEGAGATEIRSSIIGSAASSPENDQLLDDRACDCCQTDAAVTSRGVVVADPDPSERELRDISTVTFDGKKWSRPHTVRADGWQIAGCPVNGPQIAAAGENVSVAWFTMAEGKRRVYVARSTDGGNSFAEPFKVDDGKPAGRVDIVRLPSGSDVVSWVEQNGDQYEVRIRELTASGNALPSLRIGVTGSAHAGFPRMAATDDALWVTWTERKGIPHVHLVRANLR
jgi:hypothetical protein